MITDPIEGRIKSPDEVFEITGTATAPSGINRVELEIMDRNTGRYLADDLTTWGSTTLNTFNATLDAGTGANRTWRLPVTIAGNRELQVRARAVASNGTADNTKAAKKFETFGIDDLPPEYQRQRASASPVSSLDVHDHRLARPTKSGSTGVSFTLRDSQGRYLQEDGTVSGTYNTFQVELDVVGATSTTWSHEITVPFEDEWLIQARAPTPPASPTSTPPTGPGSSPRTVRLRRCRSPSRWPCCRRPRHSRSWWRRVARSRSPARPTTTKR